MFAMSVRNVINYNSNGCKEMNSIPLLSVRNCARKGYKLTQSRKLKIVMVCGHCLVRTLCVRKIYLGEIICRYKRRISTDPFNMLDRHKLWSDVNDTRLCLGTTYTHPKSIQRLPCYITTSLG